MNRADLITLVSRALASAPPGSPASIICEELATRLVEEANGAKVETALTALAEDNGVTDPPECPACARRKVAKLAAQKRWRESKRKKAGKRKPRTEDQ